MASPPVAEVYHRNCPFVVPVALSIKVVPGQALDPVTVGGGVFIMVAITAVLELSHPPTVMDVKYVVVVVSTGVV